MRATKILNVFNLSDIVERSKKKRHQETWSFRYFPVKRHAFYIFFALHFIRYFARRFTTFCRVYGEFYIFKNDLTDSKQITCMNEIKLNLRSKTNNSTPAKNGKNEAKREGKSSERFETQI